jgi:hypothetical protein
LHIVIFKISTHMNKETAQDFESNETLLCVNLKNTASD